MRLEFAVSVLLLVQVLAEDFCYEKPECGPSTWPGTCATGQSQTPIDLNAFEEQDGSEFLRLNSFYTTGLSQFRIHNNGHTAQISIIPDEDLQIDHGRPAITVSWLNYTQYLEQIHFHWGPDDSVGSEHTVNGSRFSMEIHFVHYSSKFKDFNEAVASDEPDALTVMGIFVQGTMTLTNDTEWEPMFENLESIQGYDENAVVNSTLSFESLLPNEYRRGSGTSVFRYSGSLTTPPCSEVVNWIVFPQPVLVPSEMLSLFRSLNSSSESTIDMNYRPLQPINARTVELIRINSNANIRKSPHVFGIVVALTFLNMSI